MLHTYRQHKLYDIFLSILFIRTVKLTDCWLALTTFQLLILCFDVIKIALEHCLLKLINDFEFVQGG